MFDIVLLPQSTQTSQNTLWSYKVKVLPCHYFPMYQNL
jgi:hypothetical protein